MERDDVEATKHDDKEVTECGHEEATEYEHIVGVKHEREGEVGDRDGSGVTSARK